MAFCEILFAANGDLTCPFSAYCSDGIDCKNPVIPPVISRSSIEVATEEDIQQEKYLKALEVLRKNQSKAMENDKQKGVRN